jgi:putative transposase
MQGINQAYALYFNTKYERSGQLWSDALNNIPLINDRELTDCISLIEYLPVKEGLITSTISYPWSSCSYRILGKEGIVDNVRPGRKST